MKLGPKKLLTKEGTTGKKMKLPKTFIPEKDLDNVTEDLLTGKNKNKFYSEKIILEGLSFQQLGMLADLEGKIDHAKIDFEYMEYRYQLVYTPNNTGHGAEGLLQLVQKPPCLSLQMMEYLGEKMEKSFNDIITTVYNNPNHKSVAYVGSKNCLLVDMPLKKGFIPLKRLEEFFSDVYAVSPVTKFPPGLFMFNNIRVYVEYHNLKENDMQCIRLIPKEHMLDKSKTYET